MCRRLRQKSAWCSADVLPEALMPAKQPDQCRVGRQNGKGAGTLPGAGQLQYQVVAADQQIGGGLLRQFQKHLVIRVAAFGQRRERRPGSRWQGHDRQVGAVILYQAGAPGIVQPKLRITGNAFQLVQRFLVGQANYLIAGDGISQWHERGCLKMKQIHHDVGVEHDAWGWCCG